MVEDHYDLVVVGAGPAGEKAAAQAAYFDKRVVVVERASELGGELAASALTTKAMREAALYLTGFRRRDVYGAGIDLDPQSAIDRLRARAADVAGKMSEAVRGNLDRHGIELVTGTAVLGSDRTAVVAASPEAPERVLSGEMILIATGSRPFHPPGIPFDDPDVLDSETARELYQPMESLVVVGGGAVACEYASIFMALGAEVTLVDRGERLMPFLDSQCSAQVAECFRSFGMSVLPRQGVTAVARDERWTSSRAGQRRAHASGEDHLRRRAHGKHGGAGTRCRRGEHRRAGADRGRRSLPDDRLRDLCRRRRDRAAGSGVGFHGTGSGRRLLWPRDPFQGDR